MYWIKLRCPLLAQSGHSGDGATVRSMLPLGPYAALPELSKMDRWQGV